MRTPITIAALFAATALATPAMAQDVANFTGPRVEALVGYESFDVDEGSEDGVTYAIAAGYDFDLGGAIAGVEVEYGDSDVGGCLDGVLVSTDELCFSGKRDLYAGARVGFVVGSNLLLYGKAGYSNAQVGLDYEDGTAGTTNDFSVEDELDGVRVGAGAEFALGTNLYLKGEYRYSNYEQGFSKHQGMAGLGFRF